MQNGGYRSPIRLASIVDEKVLTIIDKPVIEGEKATALTDIMKKNNIELGKLAKFFFDRRARVHEQHEKVKQFQKEEKLIKSLKFLITAYDPEPKTSKQQERIQSSHRRQMSAIEAKKSPSASQKDSIFSQTGYFSKKGFKIVKSKSIDQSSSRSLKLNKSAVSLRKSMISQRGYLDPG